VQTEIQLLQRITEYTGQIAALQETTKAAHKRLDDNDQIISGIHELAKNIATMAAEIKLLTEKVDKSIDRMEQGQEAQGERIRNVEVVVSQVKHCENEILKLAAKLDIIEKEPGQRWKDIVKQATGLIIAAILGGILAGIFQ
jgi:methyl-accepting chemotaxis protein